MSVAVLAGGVGAARFLQGLIRAVPPSDVAVVVNTGDDTIVHGLAVSPDLDTVTYTLAEAIDPDRGWGLADETWRAMEALQRYVDVRPEGSTAAPTWFNLGDRDLATHFYRTARLAEGADLTAVTAEITQAWDLTMRILPMTNDRFRTVITLAVTGDEVAFQDYFVRLAHSVPVERVRFEHDAELTSEARSALQDADVVVIAPSNPLVSIGPIRALPGVDELLTARRSSVVAVSPIVGGAALKGPADRMLHELGLEPSVVGIARLYAPVAGVLVIDPVDADLADAVERVGLRCVVEPSIMSTPQHAETLARRCLAAV
ncbi:MAG: 2-phospho-L-lactate transferase [Ilumatobacteraceae bacterium]